MKIETEYYVVHGTGNLLCVTSLHAWDEKIATDFCQAVEEVVIHTFRGKPWGCLNDARYWQLGTPGVEAVIEAMMAKSLIARFTHNALVTGVSQIKRWQASRMFNPAAGYCHKVFEDVGEAREWLARAGYTGDCRTGTPG